MRIERAEGCARRLLLYTEHHLVALNHHNRACLAGIAVITKHPHLSPSHLIASKAMRVAKSVASVSSSNGSTETGSRRRTS